MYHVSSYSMKYNLYFAILFCNFTQNPLFILFLGLWTCVWDSWHSRQPWSQSKSYSQGKYGTLKATRPKDRILNLYWPVCLYYTVICRLTVDVKLQGLQSYIQVVISYDKYVVCIFKVDVIVALTMYCCVSTFRLQSQHLQQVKVMLTLV